MIIVMLFLYPLLKKYRENFYDIIVPLLLVMSTGLLFQNYNNLDECIISWNTIIYGGIIRATMGICGGCLLWNVHKRHRFNKNSASKYISIIAEFSMYIVVFWLMSFLGKSKTDIAIFFVLLLAIFFTITNDDSGIEWFDNKFFYWLGDYSFSLFLGHTYLRQLHEHLYPVELSTETRMFLYIIDSAITGVVIMYVSKIIKRIFYTISLR